MELEAAWQARLKLPEWNQTQAIRVFHGPGEGRGELGNYAIDRFGDHAWVTEWEPSEEARQRIARFLEHKVRSAVILERPRQGVPATPRVLVGDPPQDRFEVKEYGARFWIRLLETKHPGLFLDHYPLRLWLAQQSRGWKVLNAFAYTGSLSVAAGLGGATQVDTLDLSKATLEWARDNWLLNALDAEHARFIAGDALEWFPRLKRQGQLYDCVILDPPSFSRAKKGTFSTARDLEKLHALALELVRPGGMLVTSINSAKVTRKQYRADVQAAAGARKLEVVREISLPATFPGDDYLKGWIFKVT